LPSPDSRFSDFSVKKDNFTENFIDHEEQFLTENNIKIDKK